MSSPQQPTVDPEPASRRRNALRLIALVLGPIFIFAWGAAIHAETGLSRLASFALAILGAAEDARAFSGSGCPLRQA